MWRYLTLILCLGQMDGILAFDSCHYSLRADFVAADACPGQDIGLTNISLTHTGHYRWQWFLGDGRYSEEFNPVVNYPRGGVYRKITLKVYDSFSHCRDSIQKTLEVFPQPESDFKSVCTSDEYTHYRLFSAYKSNPIDHAFTWYFPWGDSVYITGKNNLLIPDTFKSGTGLMTLKVQSAMGCVSVTSRNYNVVGLEETHDNRITVYGLSNTIAFKLDDCANYSLFNAEGRWLQNGTLSASDSRITDLQSGVYYVVLNSEKHQNLCFKVIVY